MYCSYRCGFRYLLTWITVAGWIGFGLCGSLAAQTKAAARSTKAKSAGQWTVEDLVLMEEATSFRISPDGRWAAWVKYVPEKEQNESVAYLMLSSLQEDHEIQLTRSKESCTEPKWSPDGRHIAFLSSRPAPGEKPADSDDRSTQVWLIKPSGGEPWPLTEQEQSVTKFEWADSERVVFLGEESSDETSDDDEPEDTTIVVEDDNKTSPALLFECQLRTKKVRALTDNTDQITDFALSPDGKSAATIHQRSKSYLYDHRIKPASFLYDLRTGKRQPMFADVQLNLEQLCWSLDGAGCYVTHLHSSDSRYAVATVSEVHYFDLASGTTSKVPLAWERGLTEQVENEEAAGLCVTSGGFVALLANGARTAVARYTLQAGAWKTARIAGDHAEHIHGLEVSRDGKTIVYAASKVNQPTQWFRATLNSDRLEQPVQLTHLNGHLRGKAFAKAEVIHWKGGRNEEVEGLLYYPHHYEAGRKYPLIVNPHGGPLGADCDAWNDSWAHPQNLLCERGAFVLKPNYHGSSNYGLAWAESIGGGNYYDLELPDIERGVDALIAQGLADPERLGLMGYSNGAILAAALTVRTQRYKAASCLAGNVEQTSDWAFTEDGASFDQYYFGKSPLEEPSLYLKKSPFYELARVTTPTLIFFGKEDRTVGPHQGWMHFRALQQSTKTPVRFLLFPGEEHDITQLTHQRRKIQEEIDWFEKYLFRDR